MNIVLSNNFQSFEDKELFEINGGSYSTWFKAVTITLAVAAATVALAPAAVIAAPVAAVVSVTLAHTSIYTGAIYVTALASGK